MAKKAAKKKKTAKRAGTKSAGASRRAAAPDATGKHLVIVESPTKAKTINRYLGPDYVVMASVGHVRDLPKSPPKGAKRKDHPVPGVDLEHDFKPTYEVMPDSKKTVTELKKAAKQANDIWFATDLDREGEAIAWHLTHALGVSPAEAKRVVFNAITKGEIEKAFAKPRNIEQNRVDAQQARRILDRIVGYQVSPLLWKKVAGGLSAGRVQSVATRLVVEREREIAAFVPDEYWKLTGLFTTDAAQSDELGDAWREFINRADP
ncbi:MAG: DNA topoisomerase, partial [Planctomycetota bacterium]